MTVISRKENWSTIAQSQVLERNSRQPTASSCRKLGARSRTTSGSRISAISAAARRNVAASTAIAQPGPNPATRKPATAAPPIIAVFIASWISAFACWSREAGTVCGITPDEAGKKNADAAPLTDGERGEVPDLRIAGDQQRRGHCLGEPADHVRADHDPVAGQAVGPDAADEQEDDQRDLACGEDQAEVGLRARQLEDGERQRDRRDRAADQRDRAAGEEEAELALSERRATRPHATSQ